MDNIVSLVICVGLAGGFGVFCEAVCSFCYWFIPKRTRGFEVVSTYDEVEVSLPKRQTANSAGYDICILDGDMIVPGETKVFSTGLKAYMGTDEFLGIHIRSSIGIKRKLILSNITGIIDSDYYNNPDNEGHIMIALTNIGNESQIILGGERIAQGIFYKYLKADNDKATSVRTGGIGSTL